MRANTPRRDARRRADTQAFVAASKLLHDDGRLSVVGGLFEEAVQRVPRVGLEYQSRWPRRYLGEGGPTFAARPLDRPTGGGNAVRRGYAANGRPAND